jgi:hypothetical protein
MCPSIAVVNVQAAVDVHGHCLSCTWANRYRVVPWNLFLQYMVCKIERKTAQWRPNSTHLASGCTAKAQYRKFETHIPRKVIARPQSQFLLVHYIPVSVSELYIYSPDRSANSTAEKICGPILGIYKSLTDTWMWKLGLEPRTLFKKYINGILNAV